MQRTNVSLYLSVVLIMVFEFVFIFFSLICFHLNLLQTEWCVNLPQQPNVFFIYLLLVSSYFMYSVVVLLKVESISNYCFQQGWERIPSICFKEQYNTKYIMSQHTFLANSAFRILSHSIDVTLACLSQQLLGLCILF